jgi:hypothetical protein
MSTPNLSDGHAVVVGGGMAVQFAVLRFLRTVLTTD